MDYICLGRGWDVHDHAGWFDCKRMTPNARALMISAPADEQGESSGLLATGRVLGQCMSVALGGAIFTGLGGAAAGRTLLQANAVHAGVAGAIAAAQTNFLTGFHAALLACAGVAAMGVFAALIRGAEHKPALRASSAKISLPPENSEPASNKLSKKLDRTQNQVKTIRKL